MNEFLAIAKALADEGRVRALMALSEGELCLCEIVEVLELSPSTVSKHMSVLQQAGLVARRKEGRWRYYRLAGDEAPQVVRDALGWTFASLEREGAVAGDRETLARVRRSGREELTACYGGN